MRFSIGYSDGSSRQTLGQNLMTWAIRLSNQILSRRILHYRTILFLDRKVKNSSSESDCIRISRDYSRSICVCICMKSTFFLDYKTLFLRLRVFPPALGCGARRETACTPRRKCGSVARALGVQSREIWQLIAGLLSDQL